MFKLPPLLRLRPKEKSAHHERRGFGLVEMLVALSLILVLLGASAQIFQMTLRTLRQSENDSRALFLAQDALEAAKNIRNRSWETLAAIDGASVVHPIIQDGIWVFEEGPETFPPNFIREVRILPYPNAENADPAMRTVEARVIWQGSGGTREQRLSSLLTNWNYIDRFLLSITQTNYSDFIAGTGTNIDLQRFPGRVRLDYDLLHQENFESYRANQDPANWTDTKEHYSLTIDGGLFKTSNEDSIAFGTTSNKNNIHSHYSGAGALNWTNIEVTGRLKGTHANSRLGITFLSRYATEDRYYILGNTDADNSFMIAGRGTSITPLGVDDRDTERVYAEDQWIRFRLQARNVNDQTLMVAKMWTDGETEPASWQVDCYDDSPTRSIQGTIGLWTDGPGDKWIDDLEVRNLSAYETSGTYVSRPFDTGQESQFDRLTWKGDLPQGTTIEIQFRSGDDANDLDGATFVGPTSPSDAYTELGQIYSLNPDHDGDRWIQYQLRLSTSAPSQSPSLDEIQFYYAPLSR